MPYYIPYEIQVEIIKKLPTKSLIRFRSVSKAWKSFIESYEFITDYHVHNPQPKRLLVSYRDRADCEIKYVSIDDDDTFPRRKCSLNAPMFFKHLEILGSSHGLLCLYGRYQDKDVSSPNPRSGIVVLWNPSIRKSVVIRVPHELRSVFAFGVCPHTNDPKLVSIYMELDVFACPFRHLPQVQVFALSLKAWKSPLGNLPRESIGFKSSHIVINGFTYWFAYDRDTVIDLLIYHLIMQFDLTSEEFREIYLPECLARQHWDDLLISKLRDSLVVFIRSEKRAYGVWMMEHGVPNSFTKLFTIDLPNTSLIYYPLKRFRGNGEVLLETMDKYDNSAALTVYEPSSKHIKDLGIYGEIESFFVSSYMETLILLDHQDYCIYG